MSRYHHVIDRFEFITGSKGVFKFVVNEQVLFSKKDIGRHAEPDEILSAFQAFVGPDVEPYPEEL